MAISLVVVLIGVILSTLIGTNFGKTKIEHLQLVDKAGYRVSANLYIPKTATSTNPAPAMIVVPGGDDAADSMSPWADELSRRGYVVVTVDYSGEGDTEVNPDEQYFSAANGAMELDTAYDYISNLAFVDKNQIGVGGHSMGSMYSFRLALVRHVKFVVSDVIYNDKLPDYNFNFIQICATHDEGILGRVSKIEDLYTDKFLCSLFGTDNITPNKVYGSWQDSNARVLYTVNQTHPDDMVRGQFIEKMLSSVMKSADAPTPINPDNHIYAWKIVGMIIAVIGMGMFLFSLAGALLETAEFGKLKLSNNKQIAGLAYKSKAWWIYAVILSLVPVITFFPGTAVGNSMTSNNLFKLGTTPNGFMVWSLFSAVLMLALFFVFHFTVGKKQGGNLSTYGFGTIENKNKITLAYIGRSALFAVILYASAYFLMYLIYNYAKTDLHIWTVDMRPLALQRIETFPWYYLGLLPYFVTSLLAGKALSFGNEDDSKGKSLCKSVIFGTVIGMIALVALYIVHEVYLRNGTSGAFYKGHFANFYMTSLECMIPEFGFASALALYINKKTKNNFAGIFIGVALVTFFIITSNALSMII